MHYLNYYLGKNLLFNHLPSVITSHNHNIMKDDSGVTSTYIKELHAHYLQNLQKLKNGPRAVPALNLQITYFEKLLCHLLIPSDPRIYATSNLPQNSRPQSTRQSPTRPTKALWPHWVQRPQS